MARSVGDLKIRPVNRFRSSKSELYVAPDLGRLRAHVFAPSPLVEVALQT